MRLFPDGQQARNNNLNYWSYLHWVFGNLINMGLGWSAPIQVTLCPRYSCYSLNRGIRHLERSFHLASTQGGLSPPLTTLGDYHPLERIITSHYPGGLSPPREDYHLSLTWGIITPYRGLPFLTILGDYHPLERIITSPLVDFGLLHQYVEKIDLLSIFGVLHPLSLFPTIIQV